MCKGETIRVELLVARSLYHRFVPSWLSLELLIKIAYVVELNYDSTFNVLFQEYSTRVSL